jgi:hypothetical protein
LWHRCSRSGDNAGQAGGIDRGLRRNLSFALTGLPDCGQNPAYSNIAWLLSVGADSDVSNRKVFA